VSEEFEKEQTWEELQLAARLEEELGVGDDTGQWVRFAADEGEVVVPELAGVGVTPAKWDYRIICAWIVWIALGAGLEFGTLLDGSDATPPLTWVLVRYVPEVIVVGFATWLVYHFAGEYWKKGARRG
jgi:hypothetical protein